MTGSEGDRPREDPSRAGRDAEFDAAAAAAVAGDLRARDAFLGMIRQPVVRYCRARIGPAVRTQTAEDVAQEVLLAVCEAIPRFRPTEVPVMAFVYGIARNKVADSLRASGRDRSDPTDAVPDRIATDVEPEAGAVRAAEARQLRALLAKLPSTHREVLVLRVAMQFSAEETARTIGSTAGAVRVTQHRALARLRALLADHMAEPVT